MLAVQKPRFPILIKFQRELQFSRWQFPVNKDAPAISKRQPSVQSHAPEPISLILCEKKSYEKDNF
jgi:hypothetical protein